MKTRKFYALFLFLCICLACIGVLQVTVSAQDDTSGAGDGSDSALSTQQNSETTGAVFTQSTQNQPPTGKITSISAPGGLISPGLITGWVKDPNITKATAHFYLDGRSGQGEFLGSVTANIKRGSDTGAIRSGFQFQIPIEKLEDGQVHKVYAYAIDAVPPDGTKGPNPQLTGSPMDTTPVPVPTTPVFAVKNVMIAIPTLSSVTLLVNTSRNSDVTVNYGPTTSYGKSVASTNQLIHKILIPGLNAGSTYHYKITAKATGNPVTVISTADTTFKTQIPKGTDFTFAVVSDMQSQDWSTVASLVQARNPDLLVVPGDDSNNAGQNKINRLDYYLDRWQQDVFNYTQKLTNHIASYFIMGNHDYIMINNDWRSLRESSESYFSQILANPYPGNYYSFDYGDVHFAALNTQYGCSNYDGKFDAQRSWLDGDLAATQQKWKIVLLHIPTINPSGVSRCFQSQADALHEIFKNRGVRMAIFGHSHTYQRWVKDGVYYITNTTAGPSQQWPAYAMPANNPGDAGTLPSSIKATGYLVGSVSPTQITLSSYSDSNQKLDEFTLYSFNPAGEKQQWFFPNYHYKFDHPLSTAAWGNYFTDESQLTQTLSRIHVFGLFEEEIKQNDGNFLSHLVPILKKNNIVITTEGLPAPTTCNADSTEWANYTLNGILKPLYDNGGTIEYFSLDTLPATRFKCGKKIDQVVDEIVNFMDIFNKAHPETKFGLISNFPNYGYGTNTSCTGGLNNPDFDLVHGDYKDHLEKILSGVETHGKHLYYVLADNPYDYATGNNCKPNVRDSIDWMGRIVELEKQVKSHGLRFGLIYNSATPGKDGSDQQYYTDTRAFIQEYKSRGGDPHNIIIESWYQHPSELFPDTKPYTFTYLIKNVFPVISPIPAFISGDLDHNKKVDITDYSILTGNFGKTGTHGWITSDINEDGKVDLFDYNILVGNWGK